MKHLTIITLIAAICLLSSVTAIIAAGEPDSTKKNIGEIIGSFYNLDKFVVNSPNLELDWGISFLSLPEPGFDRDFAPAYQLEIKYGFTRLDSHLPVRNRIYYASDNAFVGNYSSHLKPRAWQSEGITTDNWRFGFSYRNGYGYLLDGSAPLLLYHAGSLGGAKIDIENPPANNGLARQALEVYDVKYKFWSSFEGGIKLRLKGIVNVYACYEHSIVYRQFAPGQWLGASLTELLPQRLIDAFSMELLSMYPDTYPVINFFVKNTVSAFIYEMKRRNMFFPFASGPGINYDSYKLGLSLIF